MNYRVGQRVRIVFSFGCPHLIGTEATILSGLEPHMFDDGEHMAHEIKPDGWESNADPRDGVLVAMEPWQLSPLQDDGRKVVEWSECLWQPNHESAPA